MDNPRYESSAPTLTPGQSYPLQVDENGNLKTTASLAVGDIEIGAVELKNGATDDRASIDTAGALLVNAKKSDTATLSNVAGSASSVTLLAANSARLGAVIANDSTAILYVKFGSTASATSYTYKLFTDDSIDVPFGYTGIITGIWASATGNARVTEFT